MKKKRRFPVDLLFFFFILIWKLKHMRCSRISPNNRNLKKKITFNVILVIEFQVITIWSHKHLKLLTKNMAHDSWFSTWSLFSMQWQVGVSVACAMLAYRHTNHIPIIIKKWYGIVHFCSWCKFFANSYLMYLVVSSGKVNLNDGLIQTLYSMDILCYIIKRYLQLSLILTKSLWLLFV